MKKLLLPVLALSLLFSSCSTTYHYNIGQSRNSFFQLNRSHRNHIDIVKQSTEWAIYRTDGSTPLFFYFKNNALVQVDRGERSSDVIIENR
jgi:hypothetical protein